MRIKILISIAGHLDDRNDFFYLPGQLADVDDAQAQAWIDSGVACAIEPEDGSAGNDEPVSTPRPVREPSRRRKAV